MPIKVIVGNCDAEEVQVKGATKLVRKYQHSQLLQYVLSVTSLTSHLVLRRPVTSPHASCHVASHAFHSVPSCSSCGPRHVQQMLVTCCGTSCRVMSARAPSCRFLATASSPGGGGVFRLRPQGNGDEPATPLIFAYAAIAT